MRRIATLATALMLAAVLPAAAGERRSEGKGADGSGAPRAHGTLASWDSSSHTFRVHQQDGSESVFHWNERTQMKGTPKVGEMVKLEYQRDASGNAMATRIAVPKEKDASARQHHDPSLTKS